MKNIEWGKIIMISKFSERDHLGYVLCDVKSNNSMRTFSRWYIFQDKYEILKRYNENNLFIDCFVCCLVDSDEVMTNILWIGEVKERIEKHAIEVILHRLDELQKKNFTEIRMGESIKNF